MTMPDRVISIPLSELKSVNNRVIDRLSYAPANCGYENVEWDWVKIWDDPIDRSCLHYAMCKYGILRDEYFLSPMQLHLVTSDMPGVNKDHAFLVVVLPWIVCKLDWEFSTVSRPLNLGTYP